MVEVGERVVLVQEKSELELPNESFLVTGVTGEKVKLEEEGWAKAKTDNKLLMVTTLGFMLLKFAVGRNCLFLPEDQWAHLIVHFTVVCLEQE